MLELLQSKKCRQLDQWRSQEVEVEGQNYKVLSPPHSSPLRIFWSGAPAARDFGAFLFKKRVSAIVSVSVFVFLLMSVTVSISVPARGHVSFRGRVRVHVRDRVCVELFVTTSVISCPFLLLFQSRPVLVVVIIYLNVSLFAWPRSSSSWLCPCITMPALICVLCS